MAGYAVIDVETTGFNFGKYDRVIEFAAVLLDQELKVEGTHTWLINAKRDVGPAHIHGIKAAWLQSAPTFGEILESMSNVLSGRIVLGHNVSFDRNFIFAEMARLGVDLDVAEDGWLCTKKLAQWTWPDLGKYSLENLCNFSGIANQGAHSALEDAKATAALFAMMVNQNKGLQRLLKVTDRELQCWPASKSQVVLPDRGRPEQHNKLTKSLVQRIVSELPDRGFSAMESEYLELLERALTDGVLSESEVDELIAMAQRLGLGISDVENLHVKYFNQVTASAWLDGVITNQEREDLIRIGEALGISSITVERALLGSESAKSELFSAGDEVCLTGDMRPTKAETAKLLESRGVVVQAGVNKRTKAVVAADTDSMSGKAAKARQYGIPVYSVEIVWSTLE
jgi:DNA polymerase-3 subunit epsilon